MDVAAVPTAIRPPSRADRAVALLAWCRSQPHGSTLLLALLLAAPVPLAMALAPGLMINFTHHDIFIPLDAAWRSLQGQWPHTDYYTPLGLSYVGMHGVAAWLWGMDGRVVIRANFVALPFVLVPGMLLAWRRLNAFSTVVLTIILAVLVTSPVFLDGPERVIAHLANYNRVGGGLCAVACLWALCPPSRRSAALDIAEAVAVALGFLILLYLKITFFVLAVAVAAVGCVTVRGFWRRAAVAGLLTLVGVGALELVHPGLLMAYIGDVRRAGSANIHIFRGFYAPEAVVVNLPLCALIAALAAVAVWLVPRQGWGVAGILAVAASCILVSTQNFGAFSAPLVVLVMLLAQRMETAAGPAAGPLLGVAGTAAVLLAVTPFLLNHLVGTLYETTLQASKGITMGGSRSATLRDVVWLPNPIERAWVPKEAYSVDEASRWQAIPPVDLAKAVLDDGFDLLAQNRLSGRRIANLAFDNPFPAALRAPPPRGVALWWDENRTFTVEGLSPDQAIGDADGVMAPKLWWGSFDVMDLLEVVQARLDRDFIRHESRYWTAWERKAAVQDQ